eukprot:TRINITY_DN72005_c0_g1_i1.p2 TRINITY_DN72005_c0_g1~~TRINITY_DN72005_c0_g1_i1.p2  ORF type:complete len:216 (+),score=-18.95 TRINITY_DN72005_c0_g1_i1:716-1363(+)
MKIQQQQPYYIFILKQLTNILQIQNYKIEPKQPKNPVRLIIGHNKLKMLTCQSINWFTTIISESIQIQSKQPYKKQNCKRNFQIFNKQRNLYTQVYFAKSQHKKQLKMTTLNFALGKCNNVFVLYTYTILINLQISTSTQTISKNLSSQFLQQIKQENSKQIIFQTINVNFQASTFFNFSTYSSIKSVRNSCTQSTNNFLHDYIRNYSCYKAESI